METKHVPNMEPITDTHRIHLTDDESTRISRMIQATAMAATKDQARPQLAAIFLEMTPDLWQMTASDSYMLITTTITAPEHTPTGSVLIDAKWITELAKQMAKRYTATILTLTPNTITAELHTNAVIHSTLNTPTITEQFPRWRQLLPESTPHEFETVGLNPVFLATVCKSAAMMANKEPIPMRYTNSDRNKPNTFEMVADSIVWNAILMPVRI